MKESFGAPSFFAQTIAGIKYANPPFETSGNAPEQNMQALIARRGRTPQIVRKAPIAQKETKPDSHCGAPALKPAHIRHPQKHRKQ